MTRMVCVIFQTKKEEKKLNKEFSVCEAGNEGCEQVLNLRNIKQAYQYSFPCRQDTVEKIRQDCKALYKSMNFKTFNDCT